LFYDSSFPLFFFLSKEMLIMALVSAFAAGLGGLLGVVLKGLFFLYKNKLDIAVVILGPMILMLASLFIIKVKIGGTIMSALHGWPYPFWVLEARDVVDGFGIDRWIFSPGSYFHYIIFDYLFYIAILALVYYAIKIINKKAVVKKINTTFALFGALAIMVLVVSSFMSIWRANISRAIARAGDCQTDADCVIVGSVCPFSCAIVANIAEAGRIEKMARAFPSTCELNCLGQETAVCEENKCRVSNGSGSEKSSGTEWQRIIDAINKCEAVSAAQAHSLSVSVKLKSGEEIEAVEPVIDDIFRVADEARSRCGEIIMATE